MWIQNVWIRLNFNIMLFNRTFQLGIETDGVALKMRLDGFESQASITIQTANPAAVRNCLFEFKIIRLIFK